MTTNDKPSPGRSHAADRRGPTARQRATAKRDLLRRRARRIRRSVPAVTAALFCTLFLVVYVQMASGHDPALSASSKNSATGSTDTTSAGASSAAAKSAPARKAAARKSSSGESESSVSSVRTSQS